MKESFIFFTELQNQMMRVMERKEKRGERNKVCADLISRMDLFDSIFIPHFNLRKDERNEEVGEWNGILYKYYMLLSVV